MGLKYYRDINDKYEHLFLAAYEKANIWPIDTEAYKGMMILGEEIEEAQRDVNALDSLFFYNDHSGKDNKALDSYQVETVKGLAISAICELLQVIAVCNKYGTVFASEALEEKGKEIWDKSIIEDDDDGMED